MKAAYMMLSLLVCGDINKPLEGLSESERNMEYNKLCDEIIEHFS